MPFLKDVAGHSTLFAKRRHADHLFSVRYEPLFLADGTVVKDKKAVIREDNRCYLGAVGSATHVIQPDELYSVVESFCDDTSGRVTQTITVGNGVKIGVVVEVDEFQPVSGDTVRLSFVITNGLVNNSALSAYGLSTRIACTNQLNTSDRLFYIKNTKFAAGRLTVAAKLVAKFGKDAIMFKDQLAALARVRMGLPDQVKWFRSLFPTPKSDSGLAHTRMENRTADFLRLTEAGRGTDISGVKGTAYGALNALTEFVNHERQTRVQEGRDEGEIRFFSVTEGSGHALMRRGFQSLLRLV